MWSLVLTTLAGQTVALPADYDQLTITPKLLDAAELGLQLDKTDEAAAELAVASRALKAYQDGVLRFHGPVWEPLTFGPGSIAVNARDPLATFAWRRAVDPHTYTAADAGAIIVDRLAVQNARRNTYLRAGTIQTSVNRDRQVNPGQREDELFRELADAADGVFYRARPVDNVAGVMADLDVLYPDAGVLRPAIRFEYGEGTLANLSDYTIEERLPLTRATASSGDAAGGRLASSAADTTAIAALGLFEDETTYSDTVAIALLDAQSAAMVKPEPPRAYACTPTETAPLVLRDFDVGDFVRLRILDGPHDLDIWVRVTDATLTVDRNGVEQLTAITLETIAGDRIQDPPNLRWRRELDERRRRLEALERRVQLLDTLTGSAVSDDPAGAGFEQPPPDEPPAGGGGGEAPPERAALSGFTAAGVNYRDSAGIVRRGVQCSVRVDSTLPGDAFFTLIGGAASPALGFGPGSTQLDYLIGAAAGSYQVWARTDTAAGPSETSLVGVTVPSVTAE